MSIQIITTYSGKFSGKNFCDR